MYFFLFTLRRINYYGVLTEAWNIDGNNAIASILVSEKSDISKFSPESIQGPGEGNLFRGILFPFRSNPCKILNIRGIANLNLRMHSYLECRTQGTISKDWNEVTVKVTTCRGRVIAILIAHLPHVVYWYLSYTSLPLSPIPYSSSLPLTFVTLPMSDT